MLIEMMKTQCLHRAKRFRRVTLWISLSAVFSLELSGDANAFYVEPTFNVPIPTAPGPYPKPVVPSCLRDYSKAVLVGDKTYGKGSVQQIVDLRDGSSIRFTIAKYYTKSDTTIHGVGLTPHIQVKISDNDRKDLLIHLNKMLRTDEELDDFDDKDVQLKAAAGLMDDLLKDETKKKVLDKFTGKKAEYIEKYSVTEVKKD